MTVKDFLGIFVSGSAVRERFKLWFPEHEKTVKLDDEVTEQWFKSKLMDFCIMNPDCFSKVRMP